MGSSTKRRPRPTGLNKDGICGDGGPVSLRAGGFDATDRRSAEPFLAAQYFCAMRGNISAICRTEWSWRPAWASRIAMPQSLCFVWAEREAFAACLEYVQTRVLGALKWWWPAALALLSIGLFSFFFCFLRFVEIIEPDGVEHGEWMECEGDLSETPPASMALCVSAFERMHASMCMHVRMHTRMHTRMHMRCHTL